MVCIRYLAPTSAFVWSIVHPFSLQYVLRKTICASSVPAARPTLMLCLMPIPQCVWCVQPFPPMSQNLVCRDAHFPVHLGHRLTNNLWKCSCWTNHAYLQCLARALLGFLLASCVVLLSTCVSSAATARAQLPYSTVGVTTASKSFKSDLTEYFLLQSVLLCVANWIYGF